VGGYPTRSVAGAAVAVAANTLIPSAAANWKTGPRIAYEPSVEALHPVEHGMSKEL